MILSEIRGRVQDRISDATSSTQPIVDEKINETIEEIHTMMPGAKWYYAQGSFNTMAQITGDGSTDSVSVKKGERTCVFTFATSGLPKKAIGGDLLITGDSESYRITDMGLPGLLGVYDFAGSAVASGSIAPWVLLDRPYAGTTDTAAAFTVTQDVYYLRSDVFEYDWITQMSDPEITDPIPLQDFRSWIPDPMNNGATGDPAYHINLGRVTLDWLSNYSNTAGSATCTATQNSHVIALGGTSKIDSDHDGGEPLWGVQTLNEDLADLAFRLGTTQRVYPIRKGEPVASAGDLTLSLEQRYADSTATDSANWHVGWMDAPAIQFYPVPTSSIRMAYGYYKKEQILEAAEDSPLVPREFHSVIVDGAIWRMLDFLESANVEGALIRYRAGLDRMRKSASLDRNRMWVLKESPEPVVRRAYNLGGNYPPLVRR